MPKPNLRAVPLSPESRLRALFVREQQLVAELAEVRAAQREARNDYANAHGLLMRPGIEALKGVLA